MATSTGADSTPAMAVTRSSIASIWIRAFPLPVMRVMRLTLRPTNPVFARRTEQMIVLDTTSQQVDPTDTLRDFPLILPRLEDYVRSRYGTA